MSTPVIGAALSLKDIGKQFGSVTAAADVNLDVEPGEFISLLGPSGSGKTTTLNMIAGFEEPSSGRIMINDQDITDIPIHRRNIGMVFQGYALFPHMTVEKNVEYPLKQHGFDKAERQRATAEALAKVSLEKFRDRMPAQLSGGQQQRVALARAIAYRPPLLLMDEPLSALDKALREGLQTEIRRIHRDLGTTVVYVTHDQDEAMALSDRIVVFNEGRIQQIGTPNELYKNPSNEFVSRFLGESIRLDGRIEERGSGSQFVRDDFSMPTTVDQRGPAQLMIRPESVDIVSVTNSGHSEPAVRAEITDKVYVGHSLKYMVSCRGGGGVVRSHTSETDDFAIGQEVLLTWEADRSRILPLVTASAKSEEES